MQQWLEKQRANPQKGRCSVFKLESEGGIDRATMKEEGKDLRVGIP